MKSKSLKDVMRAGVLYTPDDMPESVSREEREREGLPRDTGRMEDVQPDEHGNTIHLNSTYTDMIDSSYIIRGDMFATFIFFAVPALVIFMAVFVILGIKKCLEFSDPFWGGAIGLAIAFGISVAGMCFVFWGLLSPNFFTYTHYPIRFNRKTRMIHVFRHNGPGGVLSVPWDEAWFHIGKGTYQNNKLMDLRGQVMNGDAVVDGFPVGIFSADTEKLKQFWKFLVLYMEHGPQALPRDNYIITSPNGSLYNQFTDSVAYCKMAMPIPILNWIFMILVTLTRWLMMKSCKQPVWPAEVIAESTIEPNDPYVWKEPNSNARYAFKKNPDLYEKMQARVKRLSGK